MTTERQKRQEGEPLGNARHEAFCVAISEGMSGAAAYRSAVSRNCTTASAIQAASRLLADVNVSSRVSELRKQSCDILQDCLGVRKETLMRILVEIIETPVGELDARHRLAQRVRRGRQGESIEMPSKLEAIRLLAQMAGWLESESSRAGAENSLAAFARGVLDSLPQSPGLPRLN